jgi:hypothetical protein
MEELDDLDTGTSIDLWDHKLAAEMRVLQEIFAEVVSKNARVADKGRILDPQGRVVKDYSDTGVPAYMEFDMPAGADFFTLEVFGNRVHQGLYDLARVPPSQLASTKKEEEVPMAQALETEAPLAQPVSEEQVRPESLADDEKEDWENIDLRMADQEQKEDEENR